MAVNKVEANGETLINLTNDTVTADTLVEGRTAHLASGEQVTGTFKPVTGVKGNSETTYRTGNVNLTPANIGAATSAQGTKADSAVQIIQINGTAQTKTDGTVNLPAYPTVNNGTLTIQKNGSNVATFTANQSGNTTANLSLSKSDVGLSNVNNTSDANKPISTAAQAALDKQQAQVNAALKQTGYNLLKITADTQTINGVTFTVDKAAGTITANGTATVTTWFTLCNASLPAGNYVLNGCPSGGSLGTYSLVLYYDGSSHQAVDTGEGSTFLTGATEARLVIRLASGTTLSNLVFKPMIVPAELAGVPFQPYAKSNAELTSGKLDVTGNASTPYGQLPNRFELWTTGPLNYDTNLFIKMISMPSSKDRFLLLGNDDNMLYFGIEKDNFVVQTKDANSYYEFKDDGIYLNGTRIAP